MSNFYIDDQDINSINKLIELIGSETMDSNISFNITSFNKSKTSIKLINEHDLHLNLPFINKTKFKLENMFDYIVGSKYVNIPNLHQKLLDILHDMLFDENINAHIYGHYDFSVCTENIKTIEIGQIIADYINKSNQNFRNNIIKILDPIIKNIYFNSYILSRSTDLNMILTKYFTVYSNIESNYVFISNKFDDSIMQSDDKLITQSDDKPIMYKYKYSEYNTTQLMPLLEKFTHNLLNYISFDENNIVFTGGLLYDILSNSPSYDSNVLFDIDLFLFGDNKNKIDVIDKSISSLCYHFPKAFIGMNKSVIYVFIPGLPRIIQFVCTNLSSPEDVVNNFDLEHVMSYYDGKSIYVSDQIPNILLTKQTKKNKLNRGDLSYNRIQKIINRGLTLSDDESLNKYYVNKTDQTLHEKYSKQIEFYKNTDNLTSHNFNSDIQMQTVCFALFNVYPYDKTKLILDGNFKNKSNNKFKTFNSYNILNNNESFDDSLNISKLGLIKCQKNPCGFFYKLNQNINLICNAKVISVHGPRFTCETKYNSLILISDINFINYFQKIVEKIKELLDSEINNQQKPSKQLSTKFKEFCFRGKPTKYIQDNFPKLNELMKFDTEINSDNENSISKKFNQMIFEKNGLVLNISSKFMLKKNNQFICEMSMIIYALIYGGYYGISFHLVK